MDLQHAGRDELIAALERCREERDAARRDAEYYRAVLDGSDDVIQVIDRDGVMRFMSKAVERHSDLKVEDVVGTRVECPPEEVAGIREATRPVYEGAVGSSARSVQRAPDGRGGYRIIESSFVNQLIPPVNGLVVVSRDVTDRTDIPKMWDQVDNVVLSVFNGVNDAIIVHDADGLVTQMNRTAVEMLGIERSQEGTNRLADELYGPIDGAGNLRDLWSAVLGGDGGEHQWRMRRRSDGREYEIQVYLSAIDIEGRPHILAAIRDITELKSALTRLEQSVAEKEALLREIHHRVKNNFAVISSLLRMQRRRLEDESLRQVIAETDFRVRCMGFVHDRLHQSESLTELRIRDYLLSLIVNLENSYHAASRNVKVIAEIEEVDVSPTTAIPLGFITSELVSNSFKHAFPDRPSGVIHVRLRSVTEEKLELIVKDDGVGFPHDMKIEALNSLGLKLIETFVSQLHGAWQGSADSGACWTVRFPKDPEGKGPSV